MRFPHSLGLLYSAFTYYTGFKVNSGEYKVMGLAPYGEPKYTDKILNELIDLKADGSFRMRMEYFDFAAGLRMTSPKFDELFGGPARQPESELTQREMDLARSLQDATEEIMLRMARHIQKETGAENLCLAGGVALNCVGNGKILRSGIFKNIWIQPAAGDAGGALGAALSAWHRYYGKPRPSPGGHDLQQGSYLGPRYSSQAIQSFLDHQGGVYHHLADGQRAETVARLIADGKIVGYFAGRMEFGPRALGARSILGDPRRDETQSVMNLKIKFRESFRPFAPSVLEEKAAAYFDIDVPSPYMLLVAPVKAERRLPQPEDRSLGLKERLMNRRSDIPAVTHLDYSARIQSVGPDHKPDYHELIKAFETLTGCAVIVNTSFNVRGEPIVCTPEDAYRCFMRTQMDALVLEDWILYKHEQPRWQETDDWRNDLILD
jgi:carbamoyltransferase